METFWILTNILAPTLRLLDSDNLIIIFIHQMESFQIQSDPSLNPQQLFRQQLINYRFAMDAECLRFNEVKMEPLPPPHKSSEVASAGELKRGYARIIANICQKPKQKKNLKATNIPKFLFKVFSGTIASTQDQVHRERLKQFMEKLGQSKTRFDLVELFGECEDKVTNEQNRVNRLMLKRELGHNFKNVLRNKHIRNKKLYLMYCKKVIYRLDHPTLLDRLEV